jgi:hypothetical protein
MNKKIQAFYNNHSGNKVFVFSCLAAAVIISYICTIGISLFGISDVVKWIGWGKLLTVGLPKLIESLIFSYAIFWITMIREDFQQQGAVLLNVSIYLIIGDVLSLIYSAITSHLLQEPFNLIILIIAYIVLAWMNWTFVNAKPKAKNWLMVVTVIVFLYETFRTLQ